MIPTMWWVWSAVAVSFFIAISFHEMAHAWAAYRQGDPTAAGRRTLNPLAHIDWFGTVLLPGMCLINGWPMIGWAKAVPIDASRFRNPRWGLMQVALAGPLANFLLMWVALLLLRYGVREFLNGRSLVFWNEIFLLSARLNLSLAVFNMLPIPPLDGSHVVKALMPFSVPARLRALSAIGSVVLLVAILWNQRPLMRVINTIFKTCALWVL